MITFIFISISTQYWQTTKYILFKIIIKKEVIWTRVTSHLQQQQQQQHQLVDGYEIVGQNFDDWRITWSLKEEKKDVSILGNYKRSHQFWRQYYNKQKIELS
jgi:hypothetical protein